jgi:hypothetical protein
MTFDNSSRGKFGHTKAHAICNIFAARALVLIAVNAFNKVRTLRKIDGPIRKGQVLIWMQTGDLEECPTAGAAK